MPLYEYRCERGHTFEVMQRMTDDTLTNCTTCDAPVQRVFHPVAVHFKGKGFYTTDYGKGKSAGGGESAGSSDSSDASKDGKDSSKESKKESKNDSKADSKTSAKSD